MPEKNLWSGITRVAESVAENQLTAVPAGHSVSKCQVVGSLVLSSTGLVKIEDIRVGDKVVDERGKYADVLGVSFIQAKDCYKLTFDDNSVVVVSDDHLWAVHTFLTRKRLRRADRDYRDSWDETELVSAEWISKHLTHNSQSNISVPLARPIVGRRRIGYPYTLGLWLGDGTRGTSYITIGNKDAREIIPNIEKEGFEVVRVPSQSQENCECYCVRGLCTKLRKLGVLYDKHIPIAFLWLDSYSKLALLRGYMDADGYVLAHRKSAALGTTDKRLYDSVIPFIASFGEKVFTSTETMIYKGNPKLVYKFNFSPAWQPFRLKRKQLESNPKSRNRHSSRMVMSCEKVGVYQVKCISVSGSNLYLCTENLIPTHNTYGGGREAIWFKTCWQPSTVITTAPSDNQVREQLWRQIHAAYAGSRVSLGGKMTTLKWDLKPEPAVLASLSPESRIDWENNFAIGFATSPDSIADGTATKMAGWHNQDMLIIIDEAGGIHPIIARTIMEGLVTNPRVKVLAIGNATDPNSEFAQWCKPGSGWNVVRISSMDTPNYKERRTVIPGLASYEWVEGLRKKYGSKGNGFLMRCLGEFPTFKEGTYYGFEVAKAKDNGQFGPAGWDPTAEVFGFWDLGDMHSVGLFVQFLRGRIRLIDCYYDNKGRGLPEYAKVMAAKPYTWGKPQYAGPDLVTSNAKSVQTGETTRDIAAGLGFGFDPVLGHRVNDGIEAVRSIWPLFDINTTLCKEAIEAFGSYGKKKNEALSSEDKPVYYNEPSKRHNYHHWADALRHLAIYYRYMTSHGYIGYADEVTADQGELVDSGSYIDQSYDPRRR